MTVGCSTDTQIAADVAIECLRTAVRSSFADSALAIAADVGGWCGAAQCNTVDCSTDTEAAVAIGWLRSAGCFALVDSAVVVAADVHV